MRTLIRNLADGLGFNPATWLADTRRMRQRVRELAGSMPAHEGGQRIGVVLTPWMGTAVPWFSLACGLLLAERGNVVRFIIDDLPFGEHDTRFRFVVRCIRWAVAPLHGQAVLLSEVAPANTDPAGRQPAIDRLARLNAVWTLRGELQEDGRDRLETRSARQLGEADGRIAAVLAQHRLDTVFVPGGVWGTSGLWVEQAQAAGARVASYDSGGYGNLLLAATGIACQLRDIPHAFARLDADLAVQNLQPFVLATAQAEMQRRRQGTDKFASQVRGNGLIDARFDGCVLLALNSAWDSAALGLHSAFDSTAEWIVETVRCLLESTSATVVVRQHPVERLAIARSNDDYRALLAAHFGSHPRLHFIAAEDPVNSYDLLERVRAVAVYTSTIGIEAVAQGKPVVTESRSYYAGLGFVEHAAEASGYRRALIEAASGVRPVSAAMQDAAWRCYYLTQCCNWVFTPFTVEAFPEWSQRPLRELLQHGSVRNVVQALEQGVPVAYLNHLERLAQEPAA